MARKKKTESVDEAKEEIISGYKGFDKDFTCRGFQYEVGREYTCEEAVICQQGFHLCENPLHVLRYYSPTTSRFAEAEGRGNLERHKADSKVACTKIKINGEIDLKGLINAGMDFVFSRVKWGEADTSQTHGDYSAAQTHGFYSAAQTHGDSSAAQTHGNSSAAQIHGDYSAAQTHGDSSAAQTHGFYSAAQTYGSYSAAQTHGNSSAAQTHGSSSAAQTHGFYSVAQTHGSSSAAQTHGDSSAAQTHGSYSAAQTHGNYSAAQVDGKQSIAVSTGFKGKAKGALTCWLTLAEWAQINGDWQIKCVKSALVDGTVIKADCWYTLKGGEFTEA